jgi:hypothetical protein
VPVVLFASCKYLRSAFDHLLCGWDNRFIDDYIKILKDKQGLKEFLKYSAGGLV